jgi:hypothetical protein
VHRSARSGVGGEIIGVKEKSKAGNNVSVLTELHNTIKKRKEDAL